MGEHNFKRSYYWVRLIWQAHGKITPAARCGAHRRKRPRRPLVGMMLQQDASSHEWVAGQPRHLAITREVLERTLHLPGEEDAQRQTLQRPIQHHEAVAVTGWVVSTANLAAGRTP